MVINNLTYSHSIQCGINTRKRSESPPAGPSATFTALSLISSHSSHDQSLHSSSSFPSLQYTKPSAKQKIYPSLLIQFPKRPGSRNKLYDHPIHNHQVGNACGTIAMIHAFNNGIPSSSISDSSPLAVFSAKVKDMTSTQRAKAMETGEASKAIADLHKVSSLQGQSDVPDAEEEVTLHYVCLARVDGVLYEFDGRKNAPVNHGACEENEVLESSVRVAKEFMARDPENLNFSAIALVGGAD
jgi:hypothetical protein